MIIREIEMISFGKFQNKTISFSDGLNIIYGNNESGKSTIIDFIYAMLYGFGDNRGKSLSLREKYTPWQGGFCEGKISLQQDDGAMVCIYRKAGAVKKYDVLRIYDLKTGEHINSTPETIIGVNSDTFLKTMCVKQLSTVFDGSNEEITKKLSNITSGGDECADYEKACRILENIRREIQPSRGSSGLLNSLNLKINTAEKMKLRSKSAYDELQNIRTSVRNMEQTVEKLKKDYMIVESKSSDISRASIRKLLLYVCAITMCLGLLSSLLSYKTATLIFTFLSILCIVFVLTAKNRYNEKESEQSIHPKNKLDEAEKELDSLRFKEKVLSENLPTEDEDVTQLYEEKKFLETKLHTVTLTLEALKAAYEEMQKDFTPEISKAASHYFNYITDGKYTKIFCNENLEIKIDSSLPRQSSYFSGGTVDQLYLSARLALIDMLFKERSCTLLLDQPFLQYDSVRKNRTVELLENLKQKRQILIFTTDKDFISANKATEILT